MRTINPPAVHQNRAFVVAENNFPSVNNQNLPPYCKYNNGKEIDGHGYVSNIISISSSGVRIEDGIDAIAAIAKDNDLGNVLVFHNTSEFDAYTSALHIANQSPNFFYTEAKIQEAQSNLENYTKNNSR